ncbi:MAG TPA: hypothetical protein V6D12_14245 [Candidatus Obscuribacterales bacterium]
MSSFETYEAIRALLDTQAEFRGRLEKIEKVIAEIKESRIKEKEMMIELRKRYLKTSSE